MSLRRLNPPVHLLRAFSAVVRFGGITPAAEALYLTQSAVSKQVQELERWLGVALFERHRKRLVPTPAGLRYEAAVRGVLAGLEAATLELITSGDGGGELRLAAVPTFAAKWLIPRLPQFQREHPQITLHFVPHVREGDLGRAELDCAILFGSGHWPGARAHYLAGRQLALIAPREGAEAAIGSAADVLARTRMRHVSVPEAWQRWAVAQGLPDAGLLNGPQFDQFQTMIRAVMAGMGVALVPRCLVADEIASGLVSEPLGPSGGCTIERGYWLAYPEEHARLATLAAFRDWLLAQVEPPPAVPA